MFYNSIKTAALHYIAYEKIACLVIMGSMSWKHDESPHDSYYISAESDIHNYLKDSMFVK